MKKFLPLLVGVIFLAVGIFMFFRNQYLVKNCTEEVVATVVNMKEDISTDDDGARYLYYPIIEYRAGREKVSVQMDSGSNPPAYSIGDTVTILYNPNKVKEFIVKGEQTTSIFSIVFMILGVCVTGYGTFILFKER